MRCLIKFIKETRLSNKLSKTEMIVSASDGGQILQMAMVRTSYFTLDGDRHLQKKALHRIPRPTAKTSESAVKWTKNVMAHFGELGVPRLRIWPHFRIKLSSLTDHTSKDMRKYSAFLNILIVCKRETLLESALAIPTDQMGKARYHPFLSLCLSERIPTFLSKKFTLENCRQIIMPYSMRRTAIWNSVRILKMRLGT
jgi:hypothetical protein